jgi:hypothetical protein
MRLVVSTIALSIAASPSTVIAGQQPERSVEVYRVTRSGGGLGIWIDEKIIISVSNTPGKPHWIAERTKSDKGWCGAKSPSGGCSAINRSVHDWIDGDSCPALVQSLWELAKLPIGGFASPEETDRTTVTDTPFTEVTASPARATGWGATLKLGAFSGPIVDWWTQTELQLKPCWKDHPAKAG